MDNILSSPRLFDDLDRRKINSCVQCSPTQKTRPVTLGYKTTKLKRGDIMVKIRGGLTPLVWKDRWQVYMLSNIDPPPPEGTETTSETSHCRKEQLKNELHRQFWLYSQHWFDEPMYIQVDDKTVFPHSGSNSTQQWILLSSSGAIYTHWAPSGEEFDWGSWKKQDHPTLRLVGRPSATAKILSLS